MVQGKHTVRPGVNFINVLQAPFERKDPESTKKADSMTVFFALLRSARLNTALRMLMKFTPGVHFIIL